MTEALPWLGLLGLGAFHGLNPAMGWLFAVALGLQDRQRRSVLRALTPIALGHALSLGVVLVIVALAGALLPLQVIRYAGGGALILFGLYKLIRRKHPRWVGMRVGFRDLTTWSFLMASAHGAGLMLVPLLLEVDAAGGHVAHVANAAHGTHAEHVAHASAASGGAPVGTSAGASLGDSVGASLGASVGASAEFLAVAAHTLALFAAMAVVAIIVYDRVGLTILRRAWLNTDLIWAGSLVAVGVLTLAV